MTRSNTRIACLRYSRSDWPLVELPVAGLSTLAAPNHTADFAQTRQTQSKMARSIFQIARFSIVGIFLRYVASRPVCSSQKSKDVAQNVGAQVKQLSLRSLTGIWCMYKILRMLQSVRQASNGDCPCSRSKLIFWISTARPPRQKLDAALSLPELMQCTVKHTMTSYDTLLCVRSPAIPKCIFKTLATRSQHSMRESSTPSEHR